MLTNLLKHSSAEFRDRAKVKINEVVTHIEKAAISIKRFQAKLFVDGVEEFFEHFRKFLLEPQGSVEWTASHVDECLTRTSLFIGISSHQLVG